MDFTSLRSGGIRGAGRQVFATPVARTSTFPGSCTPPSQFTASKGLKIRNLASATLIMDPSASPSTGAAYLVISHGENGAGAYSNFGMLQGGSIASGTLEAANNAANVAFTYSSSNASVAFVDDFPVFVEGTGHFDDFVLRPSILAVAIKAQLGPRAH